VNPRLRAHQCRHDCPAKRLRVEESGLDHQTHELFRLFALQRGGFPFERTTLTSEEWMALGVVREEYERATAPPVVSLVAAAPSKPRLH
jgi:hypothetical protein